MQYAEQGAMLSLIVAMVRKNEAANKPDYTASMERLKNAGFAVTECGENRVLIGKNGCGAMLGRSASGETHMITRPGLLLGDRIAHLLDRGFQKFWQDEGRNVPALAEQLKALRDFSEELNAAIGLTTLYNQALGSVSARYVYDRMEGREGPKRHESFD